jgi:hypothetical protein
MDKIEEKEGKRALPLIKSIHSVLPASVTYLILGLLVLLALLALIITTLLPQSSTTKPTEGIQTTTMPLTPEEVDQKRTELQIERTSDNVSGAVDSTSYMLDMEGEAAVAEIYIPPSTNELPKTEAVSSDSSVQISNSPDSGVIFGDVIITDFEDGKTKIPRSVTGTVVSVNSNSEFVVVSKGGTFKVTVSPATTFSVKNLPFTFESLKQYDIVTVDGTGVAFSENIVADKVSLDGTLDNNVTI